MKVIKTAAMVVGAVALVATGVGAIAGGAAFLAATGVSLATVSAIGTVAGLVGTVANAISPPKAAKGTIGGSQTDFKLDPNAGIPYLVGRTFSGGNIAHRDTWGTDNQYQGFVVTYSGAGTLQRFESFLVEQSNYGLNGDAVGGTYNGWMWNRLRLPATPAGPVTSPIAGFPGLDNDFRMSGHATGTIVLKFDVKNGKKFSGGVPRQGVVAIGERVYDPRQDSTYPGGVGPCRALDETTYVGGAAAANPWCHALTWALGRWQNGKRVMGVGQRPRSIDIQTFVDAMNVADANGWTIGGVVYSIDNKWDVLRQMAQAGGGQCLRLGARLAAVVNAPKVALATINETDLTGRASVSSSQTYRDRLNGMIPKFRSEAHGWEIVPASVVRVASYVAADGEEKTREWPLPMVQAVKQAGEITAYELVNRREFGPITIPTFIRFMGYKPGDAVNLRIGSIGLVDQLAVIRKRQIDPTNGNVQFAMVSETSAKHPFALGQTSVAPPIPDLSVPDESVVLAPQASDWDANGGELEKDGVKTPAIILVGDVRNPSAEAFLVELRAAASADWVSVGQYPAKTTRVDITNVAAGASYYVAVSFVRRGVVGERLQLAPVGAGPLVAGAAQGLPSDGVIGGAINPVTGAVEGGRPVQEALTQVDQTASDVEELFDTYGDTAAAAASAAAADAYRAAAAASQALAEQAKTDAKAASDAAASALQSAQQQAGLAQGSQVAAGTAAAAAAAAKDASETARNLAQTAAGNAGGSATAAAGSASNAATSATDAGNSATAAAASSLAATAGAAATMPSDFSQDGRFWTTDYGNASGTNIAGTFATVADGGRVYQTPAQPYVAVVSRGSIAPIVGRRYRVTARARRMTDTTSGPAGHWYVHPWLGYNAAGGYGVYDADPSPKSAPPIGQWETKTAEQVFTGGSTAVAIKPCAAFNFDNDDRTNTVWQLAYLKFEDVTESAASAGAATASAASAAAAAASQTAAGQSATAANQSKLDAATSAGNASTSAGQASSSAAAAAGSESNAAGSASQANTSALNAATSKDNAAGSAAAASGSASSAGTSATNAGNSATAASGSANSAALDAGKASGSANAASTSASGAAASQTAAATSASAAASSALSATLGAAVTIPSDFSQDGRFWTTAYYAPADMDIVGGFATVAGVGRVYQTPARTDVAIVSRASVAPVAGRTYRTTARARRIAEPTNGGVASWYVHAWLGYSEAGGPVYAADAPPTDRTTPPLNEWETKVGQYTVWNGFPGAAIRPCAAFDFNGGNAVWQLAYVKFEDVTESVSAAVQASASAASAASAAASQTAAGQSASAANQSRLDAQTAAGNASTSAGQASSSASAAAGSASSAAGSASQAGTSASNAAGSATAAGGSASAASGSASNAATSANQAGNSATAAAGSELQARSSAAAALPFDFAQGGRFFLHGYAGDVPSRAPELQGWTFPIVDNKRVAQAVSQTGGPTDGPTVLTTFARIAAVPGRRYRASARYRFVTSPAGNNNISMYFLNNSTDGAGHLGSAGAFVPPPPQLNAWTEYSAEFVVPAGWTTVSPFWRATGGGGAIVQVEWLRLDDITDSTAAAGSASAAASSASAASTSQGAAGGSATSASSSANTASIAAGNASSSASAAASSAAAASASQASAVQYSLLSARLANGGSLTANPRFADWADGSAYPAGWTVSTAGPAPSRIQNTVQGGYAAGLTGPAGENSWICADTPSVIVPNAWYVLDFEVNVIEGNTNGSGVVIYENGGGTPHRFGLASTPDNTGIITNYPRWYTFTKLWRAAEWGCARVFICAHSQYDGWGSIQDRVVMHVTRCIVRPATDGEIAAGRVQALEASVSQAAAVAASADGRTQAYWAVSANAGGTSAAIEARAVGNPDGSTSSRVGIVAEEFSVTSTTAGIRRRVIRVSGTDVVVDGNFTATAGVFLGSGDKWSYQLKTKSYTVTDGQAVSFGVNLGVVPSIDIGTAGLDPLASGETYRVYADGVSATGFTARLRIVTPGAGGTVNLNGVREGSGPTIQAHRGGNPAASGGTFNLVIGGTYTGYAYRSDEALR